MAGVKANGGSANFKLTNGGAPVAGVTSEVVEAINENVPETPAVKAVVDISEVRAILITLENDQTGDVLYTIAGHAEDPAVTTFNLVTNTLTTGTSQIHVLTDPWRFITITAAAQSAFQTGEFLAKVQEKN